MTDGQSEACERLNPLASGWRRMQVLVGLDWRTIRSMTWLDNEKMRIDYTHRDGVARVEGMLETFRFRHEPKRFEAWLAKANDGDADVFRSRDCALRWLGFHRGGNVTRVEWEAKE